MKTELLGMLEVLSFSVRQNSGNQRHIQITYTTSHKHSARETRDPQTECYSNGQLSWTYSLRSLLVTYMTHSYPLNSVSQCGHTQSDSALVLALGSMCGSALGITLGHVRDRSQVDYTPGKCPTCCPSSPASYRSCFEGTGG